MLKYDSALQARLSTAPSKSAWSSILVDALGTNLTLRCRRNDSASEPNVFDSNSSIEFYNATLNGPAKIAGSAIVSFGSSRNATVRLPANLSSGASVLRIEGNGHWIEGTLGLTTSNSDFKASKNPTEKTGIALTGLSISAPKNLTSGTGPVAPELNAGAPAFIELVNWANPASPVSVKIIALNQRKEDLVYQDADLASEMGDVRITQSSETIIYGNFEFGATMFSIHGGLNDEVAGVPVHQILVAIKPYGTWATYPFADTFRVSRDTTFPDPFKINILDQNRNIIGTIEMRDQLPVNSPELSQFYDYKPTPLRPHLNCGQMLFWESARLKYSSKAHHFCPGVRAESNRPSMAKDGDSANGSILFTRAGRTQYNGTLTYYAAPQWPLHYTTDQWNDLGDTFDDPYLFNTRNYHADEGRRSRISGWDYEPGSISMHDWYIGPGGPRHDRACLHTPLVRYLTEPNGVRIKGNVPNRTLLDAYNKGYFNHSHHWVMDVKNFTKMPVKFAINGNIAFTRGFYGSGQYVPGGLTRHVDLRALPNGGGASEQPPPVKDGHVWFWNSWSTDNHHSYVSAYLATIFCNSPAHTFSGALRFYAHVMGQLGAASPEGGVVDGFLGRQHCWRLLQLTLAWKAATTHFLGISREDIETRFQRELEAIYDQIYVPNVINNVQNRYHEGIRKFGLPIELTIPTDPSHAYYGYKYYTTHSDTKTFYFAGLLQLMKQLGVWKVMRERSAKCNTALLFVVECLDKLGIEGFDITEGRYWRGVKVSELKPKDEEGSPITYDDWDDWLAKNPKEGQATYLTNIDGIGDRGRMGATSSMVFQYIFMRQTYFPEIPHPRLSSAVEKAQWQLDQLTARVDAASTPSAKRSADFKYQYPPHGIFEVPEVLGPF